MRARDRTRPQETKKAAAGQVAAISTVPPEPMRAAARFSPDGRGMR